MTGLVAPVPLERLRSSINCPTSQLFDASLARPDCPLDTGVARHAGHLEPARYSTPSCAALIVPRPIRVRPTAG